MWRHSGDPGLCPSPFLSQPCCVHLLTDWEGNAVAEQFCRPLDPVILACCARTRRAFCSIPSGLRTLEGERGEGLFVLSSWRLSRLKRAPVRPRESLTDAPFRSKP